MLRSTNMGFCYELPSERNTDVENFAYLLQSNQIKLHQAVARCMESARLNSWQHGLEHDLTGGDKDLISHFTVVEIRATAALSDEADCRT